MSDSKSTANDRKPYEKPTMTVYYAADVFDLIGPAVANYNNGPI